MASSISDLGNGVGLIYMTDGASRIVTVWKNNKDGARLSRDIGETVQPVAAGKSAAGIIVVTNASGAGSITAITINGINQIGSTITVASTDESVVAAQIVTAINAYTPSGIKHTAQNTGATITIFAPEALGSTPNGTTISITSSGGNTFTTSPFTGGSSETGVVQTSLQRKFYIDARSIAPASSFGSGTDITKFIVSRGMQVGQQVNDVTLFSDGAYSLNRFSSLMTLNMRPQSGGSDVLAFIETTDFVDGDLVALRAPSGQTITAESAPTTTSLSAVKNLYLKNNNSFDITDIDSLLLQYRYDPQLGGIFLEFSRTIPDPTFDVEISRTDALTLINNGEVVLGTRYKIYDVGYGAGLGTGGDWGIVMEGATATSFKAASVLLARFPNRSVVGQVWSVSAVPSDGDYYEDFNEVYVNQTGSNGITHPAQDTTNWAYVLKSDNTRYSSETYHCIYDIANNIIISVADLRGNILTNSGRAANANELILQGFRYGTDLMYGNRIQFSQVSAGYSAGRLPNDYLIFFISNLLGTVNNNTFLNNYQLAITYSDPVNASFTNNVIQNAIVDIQNVTTVVDNFISYGTITFDGDATYDHNEWFFGTIGQNISCDIRGNSGELSAISANTNLDVINNRLFNAGINNQTASSARGTLSTLSMENSSLNNNTYQTAFSLTNGKLINAVIQNCLFNNSRKYTSYVGTSGIDGISGFSATNITIEGEGTTNAFVKIPIEGVNIGANSPALSYGFEINGETSDASLGVDYDTAFSGGTLTIPAGYDHAGQLLLFNTRGGTISQFANLYPTGVSDNRAILTKTIRVVSGSGVTLQPTAYTAATGNFFSSDAGNVTISKIQDIYVLKRVDGRIHKIDSLILS